MSRRRPRLARTVGSLTVAGLVALNAWLVLLNLAKHDRLPFEASAVPGLPRSVALDDGPSDDPGRPEPAEDAVVLLSDDTSVPATAATVVDDWPGGHGPVPIGAPEPREVLLTWDGDLRIVGSAPSWSLVTGLAGVLGRRAGVGPLGVDTDDVSWHPDASDRIGDGVARLEHPLLYDPGQVAVPVDGPQLLAPVVDLLGVQPELYVVLVGHVDDLGDTEANAAVALARVAAVAEALGALGVDESRVLTTVAAADPTAPSGSDEATRRFNRRVEVRIENLLVPAPSG